MAVIYTLEELARMAEKDVLPEFLYAKYPGSKQLLLKYPRSLYSYAEIGNYVLMTLLVASVLIFFSMHKPLDAAVSIGVLTPLWIWTLLRYKKHQEHEHMLISFENNLSRMVVWSGYQPVALASLYNSDLLKLADHIMVEACKKVLIIQEKHRNDDPSEWRSEHRHLCRDINLKYDLLLDVGLLKPGGYEDYYAQARLELDQRR